MVAREQDIGHSEEGAALALGVNRKLDANPRWAQAIILVLLAAAGLATLLPMVNVWAISFSEAHEVFKNPMMLWPKSFTLEAYKYIFHTNVLLKSFGITVFAAVMGTFLSLVFTATGAYGLSKTHIPGHRLLLWLVIIPMLFGSGLIPMYILLKNLGLLNSVWVLILPKLVAPFNLILMRNFFWSIPESLEESAQLDGASELRILWSVILPLSKPVIATVGLFYAVGYWNDFFTGLFFISDNSKWPLQMVLRSIVIDFNMLNMGSQNTNTMNDAAHMVVQPENIKAATIIFAIVPILLVYPFLQKYFVKGIMLGSVKG
ncbi:putative aldouronate transport system permease protein [Paenibacillus sp. UNC496MF]|uniref:carbohydrate ABC transporter permease n=1 Tax=Paenibacillus sp. UNC496MF TaxID=1502753 RepID=UPI0008F2EE59|nr:carbohydrate ABC transporter permease [Paenibacillus sp. UNC496MF]SFI38416.1 putative aldouronate transport system permease protein [Paenibacillus sp. UNC496MF]